jgi:hypothetical protein
LAPLQLSDQIHVQEHIGDVVKLEFDDETISGKDFQYTVGKNTLTYSLIIALAGDFYGNYTSLPGDVEQISDNWDTPEAGKEILT